MSSIPRSIPEYLDQLRVALRGADAALVQDALNDAEEHLRAELAAEPSLGEAEVLARIVASYGAPEEVAEIYVNQEAEVQSALRIGPPPLVVARGRAEGSGAPPVSEARPVQRSPFGRFFGVAADPRSYSALFYLLLTMLTGTFYFTWVITGLALSAGLSILIIGIPFIVLFFATVRALALVEGRLVEVLLGVRMPRRARFTDRTQSIWQRIVAMFTDPRTWLTMFYMLLMLPLGTFYFTVMVTALSLSLGLMVSPVIYSFVGDQIVIFDIDGSAWTPEPWLALPLLVLLGFVLLLVTLHVARWLGQLHARLARQLLVDSMV